MQKPDRQADIFVVFIDSDGGHNELHLWINESINAWHRPCGGMEYYDMTLNPLNIGGIRYRSGKQIIDEFSNHEHDQEEKRFAQLVRKACYEYKFNMEMHAALQSGAVN
jgi:hypothetical protein